ncbi:trypsin-like serine peptidase [Streptomyces zaomyceticus]|uniref:trypsin-like serine peptidase n=1 Tax=Streptomyces zaomyceticus TaxID=68286 RepID=UPI002E0D6E77|nr:trypsin-like serine protease [Streptomyces zaomyceticus]
MVHDGATTEEHRRVIEAHWAGGGMAEVARQDAKDDLVQPAWTGGGSIARTVGRLYASSGVGGGSGACTATVVGIRTVITAAHCVRTPTEGASAQAAAWDQNLFFVPGYEDGAGLHGGFTVRQVRMAEDWQTDGQDLAMLEMNPGAGGRNISDFVGAQPISFTAKPGASAHFFGYPYTDRVLHCSGVTTWAAGEALVRVPCLMGVGASGGPYLSGDPAKGTVVAVNVGGDADASYGTALGAFAQDLYRQSEHS